MKAGLESSSRVRPMIALHHEQPLHSSQVISSPLILRAREDLRYGLCRLLSSSSLRCDCSLTQFASHDLIGSLPRADSAWLVRVGLDNARISSRISASRSGGSGDMLIYYRRRGLKIVSTVKLFFVVRTDSQRRHLPVNAARRPGRTRAGASCLQEFGSQRWVVSNPAGIGRLRD